jgi:hypothetical protein
VPPLESALQVSVFFDPYPRVRQWAPVSSPYPSFFGFDPVTPDDTNTQDSRFFAEKHAVDREPLVRERFWSRDSLEAELRRPL